MKDKGFYTLLRGTGHLRCEDFFFCYFKTKYNFFEINNLDSPPITTAPCGFEQCPLKSGQ